MISTSVTDRTSVAAGLAMGSRKIGSDMFAAALARAQAALVKGRKGATSVVLGFLNGMPADGRDAAAGAWPSRGVRAQLGLRE